MVMCSVLNVVPTLPLGVVEEMPPSLVEGDVVPAQGTAAVAISEGVDGNTIRTMLITLPVGEGRSTPGVGVEAQATTTDPPSEAPESSQVLTQGRIGTNGNRNFTSIWARGI